MLISIGILLFLLSASVSADTYEAGETFQDCPKCPEMVVVPEGQFLMGSPEDDEEGWDDERPQHQVTISKPFAVGKYEVTVGQFRAFTEADKYKVRGMCLIYDANLGYADLRADFNWENPGFKQDNNHPVVCVAWDDAKEYVKWLSKETGKKYRLLSEAEWEYVARAQTTASATISRYWNNLTSQHCDYANAFDKAIEDEYELSEFFISDCNDKSVHTSQVGKYKPNEFGVYDILGNVAEWVEDCWHEGYRGSPANGSAWRDGCDSKEDIAGVNTRVLRGGDWGSVPGGLRSAFRDGTKAQKRASNYGFRVAWTLTL
ncbi:MAG: formylglycine-generating enzyme family protein [Aestuariivita sp.]|nr:formylglycine-generating enzyme family protein [Aestuariivita sp.]